MKSLESYIYKRNIYFLILFILIDFSKSLLSFNFPYGLTLSNGNIFIIHQKGVTICDNHLNEIILNVITFSEEEEITTETSLSKITTAFQYGYIISIINDKVYIFNEFGTSIFNDTDIILENDETAEYYTLVPIKRETYYYHYVIGYIHNKKIYLLYYKYGFSSKRNECTTYIIKNHKYYDDDDYYVATYDIVNKALSCQYMEDDRYYKTLVCFFFNI